MHIFTMIDYAKKAICALACLLLCAPGVSRAEGFDFSEDADEIIALQMADAANDQNSSQKQITFSQFVNQCLTTVQQSMKQRIRDNEDTLIAYAKVRGAYSSIDQACDATLWAKEARVSNASSVPGLGLHIDLYQGVLKKPERWARALHQKKFFHHLSRYQQLAQWYNEAGKKHEAAIKNLGYQLEPVIRSVSQRSTPSGRVEYLYTNNVSIWGMHLRGKVNNDAYTAQQLLRYCTPSSAARDVSTHARTVLQHKSERETVLNDALSLLVAPQYTVSVDWAEKIRQANTPYTRQFLSMLQETEATLKFFQQEAKDFNQFHEAATKSGHALADLLNGELLRKQLGSLNPGKVDGDKQGEAICTSVCNFLAQPPR